MQNEYWKQLVILAKNIVQAIHNFNSNKSASYSEGLFI